MAKDLTKSLGFSVRDADVEIIEAKFHELLLEIDSLKAKLKASKPPRPKLNRAPPNRADPDRGR